MITSHLMLRALEPIEKVFTSSNNSEFMLMALKFNDPAVIPKVLENFKKIFVGLRTSVDGDYYCRSNTDDKIVRLPSWVSNCDVATRYMFEHHTRPNSEALCTIGANDELIVVNSNHAISDAGFMKMAIEHCFDDKIGKPVDVSTPMCEAYKEQQEATKHVLKDWKYPNGSSFKMEYNGLSLASKNSKGINIDDTFPIRKLKCFDKKKGRPSNLSAAIFTACGLAIGALGDRVDPLALRTVVDLRKFADQSKIDWSYCNHVSSQIISCRATPEMTMKQLFKGFHSDIERHEKSGKIMHPTPFTTLVKDPTRVYGNVSNVGVIKLKEPLVDLSLRSFGTGNGGINAIVLSSYSKVSDNMNDITLLMRYHPAYVPIKLGNTFYDSVKHILTEIPIDTKVKEILKEVRNFQSKLLKEY